MLQGNSDEEYNIREKTGFYLRNPGGNSNVAHMEREDAGMLFPLGRRLGARRASKLDTQGSAREIHTFQLVLSMEENALTNKKTRLGVVMLKFTKWWGR